MPLRHTLVNNLKKFLWKNEKLINCFDSFFNSLGRILTGPIKNNFSNIKLYNIMLDNKNNFL